MQKLLNLKKVNTYRFCRRKIEIIYADNTRITNPKNVTEIQKKDSGNIEIFLDEKPVTDSKRDYLIVQPQDVVYVENVLIADVNERFNAISNIQFIRKYILI